MGSRGVCIDRFWGSALGSWCGMMWFEWFMQDLCSTEQVLMTMPYVCRYPRHACGYKLQWLQVAMVTTIFE